MNQIVKNHDLRAAFRRSVVLSLLAFLTLSAGYAKADGDIVATLGTACTTAIAALVVVMGTVFTAAFVIPVGKRGYSAVKGFLSKAG